jgi:hypothetical protein
MTESNSAVLRTALPYRRAGTSSKVEGGQE